MAISKISTKILKNKIVLKGLEKISDHATSFTAGTSLFMGTVVKPISIYNTPNVEKENKHYAMTSSISSALVKFGMVETVALPIEYAINNIDNNQTKFLSSKTIKTLKQSAKNLASSNSYKLITQTIKLGSNFIIAAPKSIITVALIPILTDKLFFKNNTKEASVKKPYKTPAFAAKGINFTGNITNKLSKNLAKIINNDLVQKFANKYQNKNDDIAIHMTSATDILLTAVSSFQTLKSKKIKENRKKPLIYNNIISTTLTIALGYGINNIVKRKSKQFVAKFKQINQNDPKLIKYIEGINILRPALIFAAIYYGLLPIFSTYLGEKTDKFFHKQQNNK